MTEQTTVLVLVSPELVAQMTAGMWSAPVQVTIEPLPAPGPLGETHEMTVRPYPQAVDDTPVAKLAREGLQRGLDAYSQELSKDREVSP